VISVVRFTDCEDPGASPSAEALGYFLSVRFADEDKVLLQRFASKGNFFTPPRYRSRY